MLCLVCHRGWELGIEGREDRMGRVRGVAGWSNWRFEREGSAGGFEGWLRVGSRDPVPFE